MELVLVVAISAMFGAAAAFLPGTRVVEGREVITHTGKIGLGILVALAAYFALSAAFG